MHTEIALPTIPPPAVDANGDFQPATDELIYERRDGVAILTFNRPQARNAMTWAMYDGLYQTCEHVDADERVRVLVLTGAGDRAFVAGTDIGQFTVFSTAENALRYERNGDRYSSRLAAVKKPVIAAIKGYAVGGGAGIAMACDLRLAAPNARFGVPIARTLGNTLSSATFHRMVGLIGPARAKELLFTARFVEAEEGRAIGLFNEVVPLEQLDDRAMELARQLAGHAPLTLRAVKEAISRVLVEGPTADTDDLILSVYLSEDFKEGVSAFLEKRPANWRGR
jgi:enoyl-CoA hydratase/carnithine racemase